jgi:hypothetical protein
MNIQKRALLHQRRKFWNQITYIKIKLFVLGTLDFQNLMLVKVNGKIVA